MKTPLPLEEQFEQNHSAYKPFQANSFEVEIETLKKAILDWIARLFSAHGSHSGLESKSGFFYIEAFKYSLLILTVVGIFFLAQRIYSRFVKNRLSKDSDYAPNEAGIKPLLEAGNFGLAMNLLVRLIFSRGVFTSITLREFLKSVNKNQEWLCSIYVKSYHLHENISAEEFSTARKIIKDIAEGAGVVEGALAENLRSAEEMLMVTEVKCG